VIKKQEWRYDEKKPIKQLLTNLAQEEKAIFAYYVGEKFYRTFYAWPILIVICGRLYNIA